MNTKPLTEQTPREIDTALSAIHEKFFAARLSAQNAKLALERALARAARQSSPWNTADVEEGQKWVKSAEAKRDALNAEMRPFDEEFRRRGGWNRYYLVQGGHVHREMSCSTCYPSTQFGWLPNLSDCDENAMVEEHGDNACAICFPAVLNHPAFLRAAKLRIAQEAAEAAKLCPASGTHSKSGGFHRYVKCPECGRPTPVTRNGKYRKHTRPEKKAQA